MRSFFQYVSLILVFASCRKDVGVVNHGEFPAAIGKIVSNNCSVSGCHNKQSYQAASDYNLESWESMFRGSKSGSPVIPFNSRFSSLCYYINTFPELGLQNEPVMPLNKTPLSYEQVKTIKDWIDAGAPDVNGNIKWSEANRKKLYAVNQGCDVVTVFDSETQLPIRYIEVGTNPGVTEAPHMVRVSPDGQYWYVIFIKNNVMQKFRCSDDKLVANIPMTPLAAGTGTLDAGDWNTIVISKNGQRAYCVSWSNPGMVVSIDVENHQLLNYLVLAGDPHAIVLNNENSKIYVGSQASNFINEIDVDFTNINQFVLDNNPLPTNSLEIHDMILAPNGTDLVITCQKSNDVRIFNTITNTVTNVIPVGKYPQEIVYAAVTNQYFVSCTYDDTTPNTMGVITRINATNYSTQSMPCGYMPHGIAVDEKKKLLYVLSRNILSNGPAPHHSSNCAGRNGFVNFINLSSFTILDKKYELSVDPYFIIARP